MTNLPLPERIEDYALIGNMHTAALVHRNGSIDWLCLPRFDGGACFARLLGLDQNGHWAMAPAGEITGSTRKYEEGTLILVTRFETAQGVVELTDFMPTHPETGRGQLVRIITGVSGAVEMESALFLRFDYGAIVPWVRKQKDGIYAVSGPNAVRIRTPVAL